MKQKKTFKSLAELSTDSIGAVDAEAEKKESSKPQVLAEAQRKAAPDSFPRVHDARGFRDWGINE